MKAIAINGATLFESGMVGIKRNTLELLKQLDDIVEKGEIYILVPRNTKTEYYKNIEIVELPNSIRSAKNKYLRRLHLMKWLYRDVRKGASTVNAVAVDTLLQFPLGCEAIMIYDCIPELFPECFSDRKGRLFRMKLGAKQKRAIKRAKLIMTDSYSALNDISRVYNVQKEKMKVIPCAWDHFLRIKEDESILNDLTIKRGEYFFSLGHSMQHKNLKWVFEAAKQNPDEMFVVSGEPDPYLKGKELSNLVFSGKLNDGQMKACMKNCKAFILPSLYEGFGIPPMEAMSVGADCIVSNTGSLPEVYKKSVWFIDPYDYTNIDLKEIMQAEKEPNEVILSEYRWEKSARAFLNEVKELR